VIRGQWTARRLRNQVADLERQLAEQQRRTRDLDAELTRQSSPATSTVPAAEKPYVGLRELFSGADAGNVPRQTEAHSLPKPR